MSFQHSHLGTKSFPPPPLICPPPTQPKIHAPVPSDAASVHASAADADGSSAHDGGGAELSSSSTARPTSPLTAALFSPQQPSRLVACIRQLKSELDSLRSTVDAYTPYPSNINRLFVLF